MEEDFEECVYKYGENYYTIKEIYNLYNNGNYSDKKEIKDCICNYILAEIIKKGGFEKEAKDLDTLTTYRVEHIGKTMNKSEKVLYKKALP